MNFSLKQKNIPIIQVIEQIFASLGTFLFMIVGARLLPSEQFGVVALLWNLIQTSFLIYFSLVLLPISSSRDDLIVPEKVFSHAFLMYFIFSLLSLFVLPLQLWGATGFSHNQSFLLLFLLLMWSLFQTAYELIRWLIIRYGDYKLALKATITRWVIFFSLIYFCCMLQDRLEWHTYLTLNIFSLSSWIYFCYSPIKNFIFLHGTKMEFSRVQFRLSLPNFVYGLSLVGFNYMLLTLLVRNFTLEFLAAYQAFKSIANIFGMISQFVDNHVTAFLARHNINIHVSFNSLIIIMISSFLGLLFGFIIKDYVAFYFLKSKFEHYDNLFALTFYGAWTQLLIRPIIAKIRIDGNSLLFYWATIIVIFCFLPIIYLLAINKSSYGIVFISETIPFCLFISFASQKLYNNIKSKYISVFSD